MVGVGEADGMSEGKDNDRWIFWRRSSVICTDF